MKNAFYIIKDTLLLYKLNVPIEHKTTNIIYTQICKQVGVKVKPSVYKNERFPSPGLTGIIKKKIILPYKNYTQEQLQVIFIHEIYHYKHFDLFWRHCVSLLTIIYWFHPLSWYLKKEVVDWQEVLCDVYSVRENGNLFTQMEYFNVIIKMILYTRNHIYNSLEGQMNHNIDLTERAYRNAAYPNNQKIPKLTIPIKKIMLFVVVFCMLWVCCIRGVIC